MKKIVLILALFLLQGWEARAEAPFAIYGVALGDSIDKVLENGLERGYRIATGILPDRFRNNPKMEMYRDNRNRIFLGLLYSSIEDIPNIDLLVSRPMVDQVDSNFFPLWKSGNMPYEQVRYSGENIPDVFILLRRTGDRATVFAVDASLVENTENVIATFTERYGEARLRGLNGKARIWKNGDTVAYIEGSPAKIMLCDLAAYADVVNKADGIIQEMIARQRKKAEEEKAQKKSRMDSEL